jgi:phosphoribosylanthranilate isomerase
MMPVAVKICGLGDAAGLEAAVAGGASLVGFVFYPPSPRSLAPEVAGRLAAAVPAGIARVGVVVDPDDVFLDQLLAQVPLDHLQLHGAESAERVATIRARTGCRVIKAIKIAERADLAAIPAYEAVADLLMFDAKPPKEPGLLPGGNGLSFDWRLLAGIEVRHPWLLSGGLDAGNLPDAVRLCRAPTVDVSSGVETRPGVKDPAKIRRFLEVAARLHPPATPVLSEPARESA